MTDLSGFYRLDTESFPGKGSAIIWGRCLFTKTMSRQARGWPGDRQMWEVEMRLALISDIHGNYKALEAFLAYIGQHPADGIIGLGDYVTDSPYPQRTMKLLYEMQEKYPCYLLRGNREDYLLDNADNHQGWKPSSANGILYYTLQNITEKDLSFFSALPTEREIQLPGFPALYACHGTPGRVRGNVNREEGLREKVLKELSCRYLLGGHSHHQEIFVQGDKTYINPGSLGFAIDGVGRRAQFAYLTGTADGWEAELLSIPYDADGILKDFSESGVDKFGMTLAKAIQKSLVTGVNYFFECILAMDAEAKHQGLQSIEALPEEDWKKLEGKFDL